VSIAWTATIGRKNSGSRCFDSANRDGQRLKLVAAVGCETRAAWSDGLVAEPCAPRGIQGVRLGIADPDASLELLVGHLGLVEHATAGAVTRLTFRGRTDGRHVDVEHLTNVTRAPALPLEGVLPMAGTTNHVALGTENEETQIAFKQRLEGAGYVLTPVRDRKYFKSIYMIEPGGVRVEVATDECAGFAVDESIQDLGHTLKLPAPGWSISGPGTSGSCRRFSRCLRRRAVGRRTSR